MYVVSHLEVLCLPCRYVYRTLMPSDRELKSLSGEGAEAERADPHRSFAKRAFRQLGAEGN